MMIRRTYDLIMNPEINPLRALPRMVRFQYMLILSYIWSAVFAIWVGSALLMGPSMLGHTAVLIAVFFTADVFQRARNQAMSETYGHRNRMRDPRDGAERYDNVWSVP